MEPSETVAEETISLLRERFGVFLSKEHEAHVRLFLDTSNLGKLGYSKSKFVDIQFRLVHCFESALPGVKLCPVASFLRDNRVVHFYVGSDGKTYEGEEVILRTISGDIIYTAKDETVLTAFSPRWDPAVNHPNAREHALALLRKDKG